MKVPDNRVTRWLFSIVWRKWLIDHWAGGYEVVHHVKGWRTAVVSRRGGSNWRTMSPCFWKFQ